VLSFHWKSQTKEAQQETSKVVEPHLRVQVLDDEIVVTVPGFRYSATYRNSYDARQLVARNVPITDDLRITLKKSEFLIKAKKLANERARELGWIV
jgi:hypothetical protein